jgi:DNA-directed RNA polymerase specialized sigma24 family protein
VSSEGSVTRWLGRLQAGDHAAAQRLWERYFRRLVGLARRKLRDAPRRVADEEDVALSAFDSFCRGAEQGRFPQLRDRDDLWRLLFALTARKAFDQVRDQRRHKRGGGRVRGESALLGPEDSAGEEAGLEQVLGREPTPEFAAQVAEECQRLLDLLGDAELRAVALAKMEGDTTEQIAARLGRSPRSVERKLQLIRSLWAKEGQP